MYCFTCSGLFRSACLLRVVNAFEVFFIVSSLLAWFFIFISTFKTGGLQLKRAGVLVVTRLLFFVAFG